MIAEAPPINYLPVIVFIGAAILFGAVTLCLSYFVQLRIPTREKLSAYECGSEPISDARIPFPMRYYIIAMLFVIFDIEVAFLYPWAVSSSKIGVQGLISMIIFIALFLIGFAYAWKKGGLEWD